MDSMRSLNTSLPSASRSQPPEQLLQVFKSAALSVTNLYKTAITDQAQARQAGYQDAIEDLLTFLDRENLGLDDGEGWKIRRWATERADGTGVASSDSDDERGDVEKPTRGSTPATARTQRPETDASTQPSRSTSPPRTEPVAQPQSQPPPQQQGVPPAAEESNPFARPAVFTFTAGPQFPQSYEQDVDMGSENAASVNSSSSEDSVSVSSNLTPPSVGVSVLPRNSRAQHRHANSARNSARSSTREASAGLGASLGSKRKFNVPDFFDLSGLGTRDMFGGGKRGRFT
ncbi:hypothetical protein Plec18167_008969 [Paecilomyces lecythidis]|uniref:Uncharacterized protein n=1 Tax=Paecilomyces lecythidis TaxID=3004212 RepID=A0ABR3WT33_9EURO